MMVDALNSLLFAPKCAQMFDDPGPEQKAEKGGTGTSMRLHRQWTSTLESLSCLAFAGHLEHASIRDCHCAVQSTERGNGCYAFLTFHQRVF